MSQEGEEALVAWGDIVYMDTTYNVLQNNMLLSCLLVRTPAKSAVVGYVCAWLIHSSETAQDYKKFLEIVQLSVPKWKPKTFRIDFSQALRSAVNEVYPCASISYCYFHLMQSAKKKLKELNIEKETQIIVIQGISDLYLSKNLTEFQAHQASFTKLCLEQLQQANFYNYFFKNYLKDTARFPKSLWASYQLSDSMDCTNNLLERRNREIKNLIGRNLSELNFCTRAKDFDSGQRKIIISETKIEWNNLLKMKVEINSDQPSSLQMKRKKK